MRQLLKQLYQNQFRMIYFPKKIFKFNLRNFHILSKNIRRQSAFPQSLNYCKFYGIIAPSWVENVSEYFYFPSYFLHSFTFFYAEFLELGYQTKRDSYQDRVRPLAGPGLNPTTKNLRSIFMDKSENFEPSIFSCSQLARFLKILSKNF